MDDHFRDNLAPMRLGLLLVLLTFLYGVGLGLAFGAAGDSLQEHLDGEALAVLDTTYGGNEAAARQVADEAWGNFKRAHLHANGLAAGSLAMLLLLSFLSVGAGFKRWTSLALGVGSLGYSVYWMLAGLKAPGVGSTADAKESLDWLAIPSSAACLLGLLAVFVALLRTRR